MTKNTKENVETTLKEQGEAIADEIGLHVEQTKLGDVLVDSHGNIASEWPSETLSAYHAELNRKVISQEVGNLLNSIDSYFSMFTKETWINGLKNFVFQGLATLSDWTKEVTIEQFNPTDNDIKELYFTRDLKKVVSQKFSIPDLVQAFTNPANLANFTIMRIKTISDTFNDFLQEKHLEIAVNKTGALILPNHQIVVNVPDEATTEEILKGIDYLYKKFSSPFTFSLPGFVNQKFKTSGADLKVFIDLTFKNDVNFDVAAKFFNPEVLGLGKLITVPFKEKGALVGTTTNAPLAILCASDKMRTGFDVELFEELPVPGMQKLINLHNWFGFAALPYKISIIFVKGATSLTVYGQSTINGKNNEKLGDVQLIQLSSIVPVN